MSQNRMKELVEQLNAAATSYYNEGKEIMSNKEYDALFDELKGLERSTGIVLEDSPTKMVGTTPSSKMKKFHHTYEALSLDKTKDTDLIVSKFNSFYEASGKKDNRAVVMWKLDGSTVQLYYEYDESIQGLRLKHAVTRGNGEDGVIIDHNAPFIKGIPLTIAPMSNIKELVVRGEAVMSYHEFERICAEAPEADYANPRNLATATISMDDPEEGVKVRGVNFIAFNLVAMKSSEGEDVRPADFDGRLSSLSTMGFITVESVLTPIDNLKEVMSKFEQAAETYIYPVDGEVIAFNDATWSDKLPGTGHNPHISQGYALKWQDETVQTTLREITWNTTRTGLINPVGVFDAVSLEGTTVECATLHNISYIYDNDIRVGDTVEVYKANKIIPKIDKSLSSTERDDKIDEFLIMDNCNYFRDIYSIPRNCPCCKNHATLVKSENNTYTLVCKNEGCGGRNIDAIAHFCERDCMNITGLSKEKVRAMVEGGIISNIADLYALVDQYKINGDIPKLSSMDGWGIVSVRNLIAAIEESKHCDFTHFMHAIGISNFGKGQAKLLKKHLDSIYYDYYDEFENNCDADGSYDLMGMLAFLTIDKEYDWTSIEGFGEVIAGNLTNWVKANLDYANGSELSEAQEILKYLSFTDEAANDEDISNSNIAGKTFVITGSLFNYPNRDALKEEIEALGGKVSGSVSSKTDYLINNDLESTSGKNKKAKELGVAIISEEQYLQLKVA